MKPPYAIKSMADLPEPTGPKVVSLFSGMGGMDLGFRFCGYDILWANEFVRLAAETYACNDRRAILDTRDIRKIDGQTDILSKIPTTEVDVLTGSPPCKSYSVAGLCEDGWGVKSHYSGAKKQRTDDLFPEYARIVKEVRPKVFVAENVPGLAERKSRVFFSAYMRLFRELGYQVEAKILDAQYLGVPQKRRRLFFIGVRDDLGKNPVWPKPLPYIYTVRDAIPYAKRVHVHGKDRASRISWLPADKTPIPTITVAQIRAGKNAKSFFGSNLNILTDDNIRRKITPDEAKALSTIPADFRLTGGTQAQLERVARCVPPMVAESIARRLLEYVFG